MIPLLGAIMPESPAKEPASGAPGSEVLIWGDQLLSSAVSFNGTPATPVENSGPHFVVAVVPPGSNLGTDHSHDTGRNGDNNLVFMVD